MSGNNVGNAESATLLVDACRAAADTPPPGPSDPVQRLAVDFTFTPETTVADVLDDLHGALSDMSLQLFIPRDVCTIAVSSSAVLPAVPAAAATVASMRPAYTEMLQTLQESNPPSSKSVGSSNGHHHHGCSILQADSRLSVALGLRCNTNRMNGEQHNRQPSVFVSVVPVPRAPSSASASTSVSIIRSSTVEHLMGNASGMHDHTDSKDVLTLTERNTCDTAAPNYQALTQQLRAEVEKKEQLAADAQHHLAEAERLRSQLSTLRERVEESQRLEEHLRRQLSSPQSPPLAIQTLPTHSSNNSRCSDSDVENNNAAIYNNNHNISAGNDNTGRAMHTPQMDIRRSSWEVPTPSPLPREYNPSYTVTINNNNNNNIDSNNNTNSNRRSQNTLYSPSVDLFLPSNSNNNNNKSNPALLGDSTSIHSSILPPQNQAEHFFLASDGEPSGKIKYGGARDDDYDGGGLRSRTPPPPPPSQPGYSAGSSHVFEHVVTPIRNSAAQHYEPRGDFSLPLDARRQRGYTPLPPPPPPAVTATTVSPLGGSDTAATIAAAAPRCIPPDVLRHVHGGPLTAAEQLQLANDVKALQRKIAGDIYV